MTWHDYFPNKFQPTSAQLVLYFLIFSNPRSSAAAAMTVANLLMPVAGLIKVTPILKLLFFTFPFGCLASSRGQQSLNALFTFFRLFTSLYLMTSGPLPRSEGRHWLTVLQASLSDNGHPLLRLLPPRHCQWPHRWVCCGTLSSVSVSLVELYRVYPCL